MTTLALPLVTSLGIPLPASAQIAAGDSVSTHVVVPGVTLRRIVRGAGPWVLSVLEVDLRRPDIEIRGVRACDNLLGRERPSAIARRLRQDGVDVVGVLNADFFDLRGGTGASESNVIIDGEIVKAVTVTESPFDVFDNVHTQFGITVSGRPVLDRFHLKAVVRTPSGEWPLSAINASAPNALGLLTRWFDTLVLALQPTDTIAHVALLKVGGRGDTARYRVESNPKRERPVAATDETVALVASGSALPVVERLRPGDRVDIVVQLAPDRGPLRTVVGGWPRIVEAGRNVALAADSVEGTIPRFSRARHPRSALGISRDSLTLYVVAVDGRQPTSVGMTLEELGDAMIALGAYEAMNLDGGGSTALVVRDSVVNKPSDANGERPVGNVVAITRRTAPGANPERRAQPQRSGSVPSCVLPAPRDTAAARRPQ
ncbi:MAG TPA: phosphodiester glycosidase family protein [Gemmatimonadaceae bacterium]|nr:phosphodiester glycosidase family protein [Gemmatimonadaceae bacterium]